ncbi:hypothetical protein [Actinoallomurus acanthiterrae]
MPPAGRTAEHLLNAVEGAGVVELDADSGGLRGLAEDRRQVGQLAAGEDP